MSGWMIWLRSSWTLSSNQRRNSWASCWELPLNWRALFDTTFCSRQHDKQTGFVFFIICTKKQMWICAASATSVLWHCLIMKYSAHETRRTISVNLKRSVELKYGKGTFEARTWAEASLWTVSWWRWQQCVLYRHSWQLWSHLYSHWLSNVKDMRGQSAVCPQNLSSGTILIFEVLQGQLEHSASRDSVAPPQRSSFTKVAWMNVN